MTSVDQDWDSWRGLSEITPVKKSWNAPRIRFLRPGEAQFTDERYEDRTDSDRPWLSGTLACMLSHRAADQLGEVLLPYGEFLPVDCNEGEFVIYHCMNQLDSALDVDRSEGGRSRDGRLLSLKKPVFRRAIVHRQDVFRVPAPNPYTIFVSDAVVAFANESDLRGLRFNPVWKSAQSDPHYDSM